MAILDISSLESSFNGDIVTAEHPDYQKAITRWAANSQRNAKLIAFPKDISGVSAIIKWAVSNHVPLAVKCGGHAVSGASSVEDGVVIDLSRHLGSVKVDASKKIAYVGGGALWETVDNELIKHGLASVGGTVSHTGVGGLILGGGWGWLSGEHGLVVDNLLEATIVTADGKAHKASESENSDLFWAIRGGGGNFGVVTEFVLKVHEQRKTVFAGQLIYPGAIAPQIFEIVNKLWAEIKSPKVGLGLYMASPPPAHQLITIVIPFYNGPEEEARQIYKPLYDLGPLMDMTKEMPYEKLNTLNNESFSPGAHYYMTGAVFDQSSTSSHHKLHQKLTELAASGETDLIVAYEYLHLDAVNRIPVNGTAVPGRGPLVANMILGGMWHQDSEGKLDKVRGQVADLKSVAISATEKTDASSGYANFDSEETNSFSKTKLIFKANYPRLQQIKARYDPNQIFNKWFPIEPIRN